MVFFNWATMQMAAKIVYYGPGLCGKTSNLSYIYAKTAPNSRGEMVSLETESDRTLFFDLLPIEVGTIGGFKTRLQLYTVPGQVFYNTTRKLVLKGVDGVVFVADSQRPMREANLESFASLRENLKDLNLDLDELPLVLQYNKRDLKNVLTLDELEHDLNPDGRLSSFESSAINGEGVFETLKEITKLTLKKLRRKMAEPSTGAAVEPPSAAGPVTPSPASRPSPPRAPRPPASISAASLARAAEEGVEGEAQHDPETAVSVAEEPPPPQPETDGRTVEMPEPDDGLAFELDDPDTRPDPTPSESAVAPGESVDIGEPFGDPPDDPEQSSAPLVDEDSDVQVEFSTGEDDAGPQPVPEVKHVHVSSHMDILAELEGLRKQATMGSSPTSRPTVEREIDLDSLIGGASDERELRRRIEKAVNSDVFKRMHGVQLAVRIQDRDGETIHTLDPVSLVVDKAGSLKKLSLQLTVDLENLQ
jgi:signal recognition particle receptor subunit beta